MSGRPASKDDRGLFAYPPGSEGLELKAVSSWQILRKVLFNKAINALSQNVYFLKHAAFVSQFMSHYNFLKLPKTL
jgi:hypothetical protein